MFRYLNSRPPSSHLIQTFLANGRSREMAVIFDVHIPQLLASAALKRQGSTNVIGMNYLLSSDKCSITVINESSEVLAGACSNWAQSITRIQNLLSSRKCQYQTRLQKLICTILGQGVSISDPVYMVNPSMVWLLGGHRNHQTLTGWKLLHR
jgi:hypothetical protein